MISDHDPGLVTSSDDLTWAQIVAGFDQPLRGDVHPWPVTEDLDSGGTAVADRGGQEQEPVIEPDRRSELRRWLSGRDATGVGYDDADTDSADTDSADDDDGSEDDESRFVPDPPPPLPQLEP